MELTVPNVIGATTLLWETNQMVLTFVSNVKMGIKIKDEVFLNFLKWSCHLFVILERISLIE